MLHPFSAVLHACTHQLTLSTRCLASTAGNHRQAWLSSSTNSSTCNRTQRWHSHTPHERCAPPHKVCTAAIISAPTAAGQARSGHSVDPKPTNQCPLPCDGTPFHARRQSASRKSMRHCCCCRCCCHNSTPHSRPKQTAFLAEHEFQVSLANVGAKATMRRGAAVLSTQCTLKPGHVRCLALSRQLS
jgi:hypothetical protein